ncbi:MAG TPA: molybdopterin cofactor-binding domain-containing protein [Burkholderiales bacterium]|nr:molybdopterin cofactor-binding domain-containing protein [Burkholderiales bacterium]
MKSAALDRREFFRQSGALVVGFTLASAGLAQQLAPRPQLPGSLSNNRMLDGWLRINADGTVTVFTGKVELGQGILTALAQIAAEELDIAYERVEMISADTSRSPDEGMTAGSQSVENSGTALRFAAAEAREMLLQLAAARLGVPADKLAVSDGTVNAGATQATYWELVKSVDLKREATARARPKSPASHRIVGRSIKRRDIPKKVTGGAAYVQDIRLPGMLFGRVVRPAAPGARLENCDEAAVRAMPGVVAVVRDGSFLAVAAEREEQAIKAANALRTSAKWTAGTALPPQGSALFEHLQKLPARDSIVNSKVGAPSAGGPVTTIEAKYTRPYQCHASIGPSCAVAQVKEGKLTVWTHSQGVYPLRQHLARVMRMSDASIIAVHVEGSGCYGHNGADDVACDASLVARATGGRPVKLQWMREDEFGWEPYGSAMVMKLQARVDASGQVVDWQHETWSHPHSTRPGGTGSNLLAGWDIANPVPMGAPINGAQPAGAADRNAVPLYVFPNQRIILHYLPEMPLRTSALRTLGAYANVFALESFIDELAVAANADPVEFRLRHMKDPRARAVIEAAVGKAGWQAGRKGDGARGRGIGFAQYKNLAAYVAVVADVEVDRRTGNVRVVKTVAAVDAGLIINPDGVINQIEGGIIQSTSWSLKESVRYDERRVQTRSWADYPILTFSEVPAVDVVLLNRPEERSLGTGEGSQGPTVAAIANAIANATGTRLRDLPFTRDKVKAALV